MKFKRDTIQRIILIVGILIGLFSGPIRSVKAAAELTINPITWNVIGLDSNNVSVGPNNFPVGVRACNPVGNSVKQQMHLFAYVQDHSIRSNPLPRLI